MMITRRGVLLLLAVFAGVGGCERRETARRDRADTVTQEIVAASFPAAFIASRLVGDGVPVVCLPGEGVDPHGFVPERAEIVRAQRAAVIVAVGAGFEPWLSGVSLPASRVVRLTDAIEGELVERTDVVVHAHGIGGQHSHAGPDPHAWLDPDLLRAQAEHLARRLTVLLPEQAGTIEQNGARFYAELARLGEDIDAARDELAGGLVLASADPVYAYLATRLGCTTVEAADDADADETPSVVIVNAPGSDETPVAGGAAARVFYPVFDSFSGADPIVSWTRAVADLRAAVAGLD